MHACTQTCIADLRCIPSRLHKLTTGIIDHQQFKQTDSAPEARPTTSFTSDRFVHAAQMFECDALRFQY